MKRKYHGPRAAWLCFETAQDLTVSATTEFPDVDGIVDSESSGGGGALDTTGGINDGLPWAP